MNHLETLVRQFYEWQGYIVRGNIKVGKLPHGGWEGELDIVAYDPRESHLVHIEPSTDTHSWKRRKERFNKKFACGQNYIHTEVFPWLDQKIPIEQIAILTNSTRKKLAGGRVQSIDEFMSYVTEKIKSMGVMKKNAMPEQYGLLRTIQLVTCGYSRNTVDKSK